MDGRRRDTWRLVPAGIIYLILGCLIVGGIGGSIVQIIALVLAVIGGTIAFIKRTEFQVRKWVTWVFIIIDVIVVVCLLIALIR